MNLTTLEAWWTNDFGHVRLSADFVSEAERRWPGEHVEFDPGWIGSTWIGRLLGLEKEAEPEWAFRLRHRINSYVRDSYVEGRDVRNIESLAELGL